jgi:oxalate decarboxylase
MSDLQRREFLAAAALAALSNSQQAVAGDPSFMNNVPDPALAGNDLPTFKFALEKSAGKVIGNSYGKEATVAQLPIGNCRGFDADRARRDARAALARHRGRVGAGP